MSSKKRVVRRSKTRARSEKSASKTAEIFKSCSVDELWKAHQTLVRVLSKKIAAESAKLKKRLAKLQG
jgi:hypothetical protein